MQSMKVHTKIYSSISSKYPLYRGQCNQFLISSGNELCVWVCVGVWVCVCVRVIMEACSTLEGGSFKPYTKRVMRVLGGGGGGSGPKNGLKV